MESQWFYQLGDETIGPVPAHIKRSHSRHEKTRKNEPKNDPLFRVKIRSKKHTKNSPPNKNAFIGYSPPKGYLFL